MDWSFLANETQITAISETDPISGGQFSSNGPLIAFPNYKCRIYNSQQQMFLTFQNEYSCQPECCFKCLLSICCGPQELPEQTRYIASHPSFGEVVNSKLISSKYFCPSCYNNSIEGYYSGEQLLGAFQEVRSCGGVVYKVLDGKSEPIMEFTSKLNSPEVHCMTEIFKQGDEVVGTIKSQLLERNPEQRGTRPTSASSTVLFAAHLPIPIKICLLMRNAQRAVDTFRSISTSKHG